jgi:hypothetical protein
MADKKISKPDDENKLLKNIGYFEYFSNDRFQPFPPWARYYLHLGAALSNFEKTDRRFIIAISTPVRAFASSLIATGIIISRFGLPNQNIQLHIKEIQGLPIGAPIIYRNENRQFKAFYKGTKTCDGKHYFILNYQIGTEKYVPYENSYKIELSEKQNIQLPNYQSGRQLQTPSAILKKYFELNELKKFLIESKLECVLLGQTKLFHEELCNLRVAIHIDEIREGNLIDFVRIKGNQFQPSNLASRSLLLPSSNSYSSQFISKLNNYVTIFDNAIGFIKSRYLFRNSNWITLLDKTDRNYDLAIMDVNEEFQNHIEKPNNINLPNPPAGVDLMFFEVTK